jgi:hypothetical protein
MVHYHQSHGAFNDRRQQTLRAARRARRLLLDRVPGQWCLWTKQFLRDWALTVVLGVIALLACATLGDWRSVIVHGTVYVLHPTGSQAEEADFRKAVEQRGPSRVCEVKHDDSS